MKRLLAVSLFILLLAGHAQSADPRTEVIDYKEGETALAGYLARPAEAASGKRPGMLIIHAWRGHSENVQRVAREMAAKGYVAFALDMYGKGVLAKDNREASKLATPFYKDPDLFRRRARAGLEVLASQPDVNSDKIGAVGFCFGGSAVLELARDGAKVAGVVSFHGNLSTTKPAAKGAVQAKVLVAHGGDDPFVKPDAVSAFWQEMRDAGADYQILVLSNAVHSFTDPGAGNDPSRGAAYAPLAADRAWRVAHGFFHELFATR